MAVAPSVVTYARSFPSGLRPGLHLAQPADLLDRHVREVPGCRRCWSDEFRHQTTAQDAPPREDDDADDDEGGEAGEGHDGASTSGPTADPASP